MMKKRNMWCDYHQSTTHSTENCQAKKHTLISKSLQGLQKEVSSKEEEGHVYETNARETIILNLQEDDEE